MTLIGILSAAESGDDVTMPATPASNQAENPVRIARFCRIAGRGTSAEIFLFRASLRVGPARFLSWPPFFP